MCEAGRMRVLCPVLLLAVLPLTACGPGEEPPHLLYSADVQSLDNPFPDARMLQAGGARLRPEWYRPFLTRGAAVGKTRQFLEAITTDAATQIAGFNNFGPTLLRATEPLDPATVAGHVARLRKVGSAWEMLEADVAVEHSFEAMADSGKEPPADYPDFILARPGVALAEADEGLLVLTRGVMTRSGKALGRGFEWDRSKPALAPIAKALGVKEDDILLALPQKPAPVLAVLQQVVAWTEANGRAQVDIPAKATISTDLGMRPVGVWKSTDPDFSRLTWLPARNFTTGPSRVERVVLGDILLRDLREGGVWKQEWVDDPSKAPVVRLPFVLSIPSGTKPANGWPTVIGAHGLNNRNTATFGNDMSFCLELAELLAKEGLACIGIDDPNHGARGNSFDFLMVSNLPGLRDEFRQMDFDLAQLARTAPSIDVDGDGQGDLDPALGYFGNSLGGLMGAGAVPLSPRINRAVLNVPGAGLTNILVSADIRDRLGLLLVAQTSIAFDSPDYYSTFPLFRAVGQAFVEPADPINFAQVLPAERAILIQEGVNDRTVPNLTTEALAKVLAVDVPGTSVTGASPLRVMFRADAARWLPADRVAAYNGHNVFWDFEPVRRQAMTFLRSNGRELVVP